MIPIRQNISAGSLFRRTVFISVIIFLFCGSLSAQTVSPSAIGEGNYCEELYIQTDRDIYVAGEEVYLKVREFGGLTHTSGSISRVVYVDMPDNSGAPVIQLKIATDGFTGSGAFRIPDTLRTGCYFVRSFTSWMKNYPQSSFAYKKISVINPFESMSRLSVPPVNTMPDSVIFYPETGHILTGIMNRVGFQCFDKDGDPVITQGVITGSGADTLAQFRTDRYGTGIVSVNPSSPGNLYMVATDSMGRGRRFEMPSVNEAGLTFRVTSDKQAGVVKIRILKNKELDVPGGRLGIIYSHPSFPLVRKEISADRDSVIVFDQEIIPAGMAKIIITDIKDRELASGWFYNDKTRELTYDVKVHPGNFSPREKVRIEIIARDEKGDAIESDLCVSVIRPVLKNGSHYNELTRRIQSPALQALKTDLILPVLNDYMIFYHGENDHYGYNGPDSVIKHLPEPEGHVISGVIRDKSTDEPLAEENITLSFVGKTSHCNFTRTGKDGVFNVATREYGVKEMVIQPLSPETDGYYVDLKDPFLLQGGSFQAGSLFIDTTDLEEINKAIISMQVRDIYDPFLQTTGTGSRLNGRPDFYGEPDNTILLSDYIELTTLREVFKEIVPGASTVSRNGKSSLRLINSHPDASFISSPLVIVDGVPIYDFEKILDIKSSEIEKIEVLNTRYFIADLIIEGIINIVSKKGNLSILEFDQSIFRQEFTGLDDHKFSSQDYSTSERKSSRIPDFRNTLYWNPDVRTDKTGAAAFEFYTSDETGEYTVVVEGFAADGKSGRSVSSFTVRN
jgi:hypothetical protein